VSARKLSVTITGPEGMLGAMAKLLRREGYTVVKGEVVIDDSRHTVSTLAKSILAALGMIDDVQLEKLAKHWRFAELEQKRRRVEERKRKRGRA